MKKEWTQKMPNTKSKWLVQVSLPYFIHRFIAEDSEIFISSSLSSKSLIFSTSNFP